MAPADPDPGLDREIAAWLATEVGATLRDAPRTSTIVPTLRVATGGERALAVLRDLAGASPLATAQLRQGEVIASGGMGVIRLAEQVALGRTVAVKTLRDDRRREPRAALDLLREAWVTGVVEHPNVVPVHHVGLDASGAPMIVLKRIEGVEWSTLVDDADEIRRRFGAADPLAWNVGILMQVLNAIRFAHSRGIIHRDLKPANVMIGEFGEVYLLDWGIAVSVRDDGTGRLPLAVNATEPAGTPVYMAPEMLRRDDAPPLSERTDVYLAGAVLFELIAGHPPHDGATALAVLTSVIMSTPALPPGAPPELAGICNRAMCRDPEQRFESVEALRLALHGYLEHRGSARLADGARIQLDALLALVAAPPADPATAREAVHRVFSACRFGFHEALVAWRDNHDARAGLVRATVAVVEFELAMGDPRAAVGLLSELDDPPPALLARVRAAAAAQTTRDAELEGLRRHHDTSIGARTRTFLVVALGVVFTLGPYVSTLPVLERRRDHLGQALVSVALLCLIGAVGWWARETLMKTALNRRVFAAGLLTFACQTTLTLGAWSLGLSPALTEVLWIFLWLVIAGMLAVGVDRRLAPAAIGYAVAFAVAARWPAYRIEAATAGNLVFTVVAVWHWRPSRPAATAAR